MGIIYVEGRYVSSSNLSQVNKKNELQDDRIQKLEEILDDSDGSVENPEVLNSLIQNNTKNITTNTEDINFLKTKVESVEQMIDKSIDIITDSLDSIDQKINKITLSWINV